MFMKTKYLIAPMLAFVIIAGFLAKEAQGQLGIGDVAKFRDFRDREFRDPKTSPLESWDVRRFNGLSYFKINPDYKVQAKFVRTPNAKKFKMPTSSGDTKVYVKYGELSFQLRRVHYVLGIYQSEALTQTEKYKNYLLIPFRDMTNGKTTYGGGRYIDLEIPSADMVTLDFNLAYNPSCAYSSRWNCPIPPKENKLRTKINAGEKSYRKIRRQKSMLRPTISRHQASKESTSPATPAGVATSQME